MSKRDPVVHAVADSEYRLGSSGAGPVDHRWSALARAHDRYESIGDTRCAAWCALDMGIVKGTELGDVHGAEALFEQARDGLTTCQDWRGVGLAVAKLSNIATVRGDVPLARRRLESFDAHVALIDATAAASIASSWADVHQAEGNWGASIVELQRAVTCYERAAMSHELLGARTRLGLALVACRRLDEAQIQADLAEEASLVARPIDRVRLPRLRASIAIARGKAIEAIGQLERALADDDLSPWDELSIRLQYGEGALHFGNLASAEFELRRSVELARNLSVPVTLVRALDGLASCLVQLDDVRGAFAAANECIELDELINEQRVTMRVKRCSTALSLAAQLEDNDATQRLLGMLTDLLERVEDPNTVAPAIRIAVDTLRRTGDELGARRLQAMLSPN